MQMVTELTHCPQDGPRTGARKSQSRLGACPHGTFKLVSGDRHEMHKCVNRMISDTGYEATGREATTSDRGVREGLSEQGTAAGA